MAKAAPTVAPPRSALSQRVVRVAVPALVVLALAVLLAGVAVLRSGAATQRAQRWDRVEQAYAALIEGKTILDLTESLQLRRSRVMGVNRIELSGFTEAAKDWLKADGFFSEIISWKLRLFCPTEANGFAVLERLLARIPVTGLHARNG